MSHPVASVIIVSWNGRRFLEPLFHALLKQSIPLSDFEVVFVDNHSSDDSVEYVRATYPWVRIIVNPANDGFARGCNLGMRHSTGEYIVLLNNDTEPEPDWLRTLIEVARAKQAGAVASRLLFKHREGIINNAGSMLNPNAHDWPIVELGANQPDGAPYNAEREITAFCGASVLLSRRMLKEIGIFDESFYMYWEDADLAWRGQRAGWTFYYEPRSIVWHVHSGSSRESSAFFTFYVWRNRPLLLMKHARIGVVIRGLVYTFRNCLNLCRQSLLTAQPSGLNDPGRSPSWKTAVSILASLVWRLPPAVCRRWGLFSEFRL